MTSRDEGRTPDLITNRRALLSAGIAGAALPLIAGSAFAASPYQQVFLPADDPAQIPAPPAQAPATEGMAQVPGAKLFYWDTGGKGQTIVLLHAATGSAKSWEYQQPVFAAAGYRVIGYSRRGAYRTQTEPGSPAASAGDDLAALVDALKLDRFHLIGTAAGGFPVAAYALANPARVRTATISCSLAGVRDEAYNAVQAAIRTPGFNAMPAEFRELSPSYRATNPEGVKRWLALYKESESGNRPPAPAERAGSAAPAAAAAPTTGQTTMADLGRIKTPTHLIYGDADLLAPPPLARMLAAAIPNAQLSIIAEAGHSASWEQPRVFNEAVLSFLRKHRG